MALSRQPSDLRSRVITCLNKLSDRDTLSIATNELESIAKNLSNDAFAPFLTCLSTTDSSDKSPVRRQCVRLLSVLSAAHGDALSPHVSKMLSSVLRRIRDPDTCVRSACVQAVSSIASHITTSSFASILKPLFDCISHEQDYNAQIGASLCLAAAIEATPEPDTHELKNLLPMLLKLVKSDCFKAKPALLSLIGSIASVGGASGKNVLNNLIPSMVEFLSNEDWAARKAAAWTLGRLALAGSDLLWEFKSTCLASLESRRFDKVKVVRETMNRTIELWKEVPTTSDDETESKSSSKDSQSDGVGFMTPQLKKSAPKIRSPTSSNSSITSNQKRSHVKTDVLNPTASRSCQMDFRRPSDWKIEATAPQILSTIMAGEDQKSQVLGVSDLTNNESCSSSGFEEKSTQFKKNFNEKFRGFGGLRFGTRVVPVHENGDCDSEAVESNTEVMPGTQEEFENLSLIHKQLCQIESQQSCLLDLLQRFIGHSQNGMNCLERRVNGLEKVLGAMLHDLAISTQRISSSDATGNTCCMLPGAENLSPKFWRKSGGQSSSLRGSFPGRFPSLNSPPTNVVDAQTSRPENSTSKHQIGIMSVDSKEDAHNDSMEFLGSCSNRSMKKKIPDSETSVCHTGGLGSASQATYIQQLI